MSRDDVLLRFSKIIESYGVISSDYYDQLPLDKPSRWTLRQHFGTWKKSVDEAVKLLEKSGIEVKKELCESASYSDEEVAKLIKQVEELSRHLQTPKLCLEGVRHRFGYTTDNHFGSLYADLNLLDFAYDTFESEGVNTVFNSGDISDGIKMYKGHEFEVTAHGADYQIQLIQDKYPRRRNITTYFITGNHDRSFWKVGGVDIGPRIVEKRPDMVYLGYQEADIQLGEGHCKATIRLSHPEDGTAYAISYKTQRYIAELASGTKPDVLLVGHYHKAEMLFYRGVISVQGGTTQNQTPFMRGRKISAAMGFWICEIVIGPDRIVNLTTKFYPIRS